VPWVRRRRGYKSLPITAGQLNGRFSFCPCVYTVRVTRARYFATVAAAAAAAASCLYLTFACPAQWSRNSRKRYVAGHRMYRNYVRTHTHTHIEGRTVAPDY